MGSNNQSGFTIVEVMLFLALTGLLFLIGFFGTGTQLRDTRFTDSVRSLHSFLQKQYSETAAGANGRVNGSQCTADVGNAASQPTFAATGGATAGSADNCVLLGKLVKFNPNSSTVNVYSVVGRRLDMTALTGTDVTDIANSRPALSPQTAESYTIQWATQFRQPSTLSADQQTLAFAFLRSPNSGSIISFAFPMNTITSAFNPADDDALPSAITTSNLALTAGYCFEGGNTQTALIRLAPDQQRTNALDVAFQGINKQTDCVK